jgi:hypothetical protein
MKILAGGPTVDEGTPHFEAHVQTLKAQRKWLLLEGIKMDIVHLDGANPDERSVYSVSGDHHSWSEIDFEWMGHIRQSFLDRAVAGGYDAVFMCDTDLLLGPEVLAKLMAAPSPITYGVFWTKWKGMETELPQVWDRHPAGWSHGSKAMGQLLRGATVEVLGGGACTVIWTAAINRGARYYPRLMSLPDGIFRGEDRTFNLTAEVHGLQQLAVGGLPIKHLYTQAERGQRAVDRALKSLYL